jgi:Spy/CpxP family protein refolding chaperone
MKKLTLLLMAVIVGVLLTVPAFAFGPGDGNCGGYGRGQGIGPDYHRDAVWKKLNLSDEQKTKIEALLKATQKELRPIREKMFDKSVELRRLWLQANPDKDRITAVQKEVRSLRDAMQDKVTAMRLDIRKQLTPEQQEKIADSGWGRGPGFGPRGGMRGHGGPGSGMGMCQ